MQQNFFVSIRPVLICNLRVAYYQAPALLCNLPVAQETVPSIRRPE